MHCRHKNKMYKRLVFYLEACESGSMFNVHPLLSIRWSLWLVQTLLPTDINVYATTAANPEESRFDVFAFCAFLLDLHSLLAGVQLGNVLRPGGHGQWQGDRLVFGRRVQHSLVRKWP